jgi:endonuclease/exonuclease/phosphatase family metal-dependent hydrolase
MLLLLLLLVVFGLGALALGAGWLAWSWARPVAGWERDERGRSYGDEAARSAAAPVSLLGPRRIKVMTWNLAYGHGPGSEAQHYAPKDPQWYEQRLARAAEVIKAAAPDVVLLQEVDFHAERTDDVDQVAALRAATGFAYGAGAISWSVANVPFPGLAPSGWLGRVVSGGAVLSRLPILSQAVVYHAQPRSQASWYNAFYLWRYTQVVSLKVGGDGGGESIVVLNSHLEDTDAANRLEQADMLAMLAKTNAALVAAGDLNAPPGDPAITKLRESDALKDGFLDAHGAGADGGYRTYPSLEPKLRLDHVLVSADSKVERIEVLDQAGDISDHLPIVAEIRW